VLFRSGLPFGNGCVSEFGRRVMLETERHKVVFDVDTRQTLGLYDLLHDPDERTNLVGKPSGNNVMDMMRVRLADALMMMRAMPA